MRRRLFLGTLSFLCTLVALGAAAVTGLDSGRYLTDVKFLASDELRGRGTGTPELEKAAKYIEKHFRAAGLRPAGDKGYFQEFEVTINARTGPGNRLNYETASGKKSAKLHDDFNPFNFSAPGKSSGNVVFAGFGITAREYGYDDYTGLDVKDKFVLLLRHEPQEFDEKSVFAGKIFTEHAQFFSKAVNAKMHGARGVILVNDVGNHPGDAEQLEPFARTVGPANAGIAFIQVKAELAERLLDGTGKTLKQLQEEIDGDLKPRSFALPESVHIHVSVDIQRDHRMVHNVAGYLPGDTEEYIVIGAHYDHLGLGEQYSMAPSMAGTPHPGADDNASGTAGVLELARWFAGQPKQKRGILFLGFAGEELGLLGSSHFVNHPTLPIKNAVAMLNMDMIGRPREGKVYVGGSGTGSSFKSLIQEVAPHHQLNLDFSEVTGYGSSDHTSFTTKQVPVLFFFSGLHGDYHKPSDTWDKIDGPGTVKLLALIAEIAGKLANGGERPQYVRVADPRPASHATGSGGGGYGPYFGSIPDFAEVPNGVRFADVRDGSPAGKAGLKAGDILTEFDGKKIQNLYDFTYALRGKKPGETVFVKVLRGSETVEAQVLLEQRR